MHSKMTLMFFIVSLLIPVLRTNVISQVNPNHTFNIVVEDGVQTAINTGGPKYDSPIFTFREVLRIRPDPNYDESHLYGPSDIIRGADGNYYIEDNRNYRIAVFDSEGRYIRSLGREGAGPGEFYNPQVSLLSDSVLQVFDQALGRITRYHAKGELLDVITIRDGGVTAVDAVVSPDGRRLVVISEGRKRRRKFIHRNAEVSFRNMDQHEMRAIESSYARTVAIQKDYPEKMSMYFAPRPQVQYSMYFGIIISTGEEPEIKCYSWSGNLTRTIQIDLPPRPVTGRDERRAREMFSGGMAEAPAYWRQKWNDNSNLVFPENKAYWRNSRIDDAGYIWLIDVWDFESRDQGLGTMCMVLSPEGEYLGTCHLPDWQGRITNGYFVCINTDEASGAEFPTVYQIESNIDGFIFP